MILSPSPVIDMPKRRKGKRTSLPVAAYDSSDEAEELDESPRNTMEDFEDDPLKYVVRGLGAVLLAALFVILIYYDFVLLQPYVNPVGYAFLIAVTLDKWRQMFYNYINEADQEAAVKVLPSNLVKALKDRKAQKVGFTEGPNRVKMVFMKLGRALRPPFWHRVWRVPSMLYYAVLAGENVFALNIFFDWLGERWNICQKYRKWLEWSFFVLIVVWVWNHFDRPSPLYVLLAILPLALALIAWLTWTEKQSLVSTALVGGLAIIVTIALVVVVHGVVIEVADVADTGITWLGTSDFRSILGEQLYGNITGYLERSKSIVDELQSRFREIEGSEYVDMATLSGILGFNSTTQNSTNVAVSSSSESSFFSGVLSSFSEANVTALLDQARTLMNNSLGFDFDIASLNWSNYLQNSDMWKKVAAGTVSFFNVISVSAAQVTVTGASIIVYFSNQIFTTILSMIMFLVVLFYLLRARKSPIQIFSNILPMSEMDMVALENSATRAIRASLICQIRIFVVHVMITLVSLRIAGSSFTYLPALASGCLAVLPFIPSPLVVVPHNLIWAVEWLISGTDTIVLVTRTCIVWVPQLFMYWYADTKVLESIDRAHMIPPYVAGLSIVSGIYVFGGIHGAIMGPILLAMTTSAYEMFTRKLVRSPRWAEDNPVTVEKEDVAPRSRSFTQAALQSVGAFAMELGRTLSTPRPRAMPQGAPATAPDRSTSPLI